MSFMLVSDNHTIQGSFLQHPLHFLIHCLFSFCGNRNNQTENFLPNITFKKIYSKDIFFPEVLDTIYEKYSSFCSPIISMILQPT